MAELEESLPDRREGLFADLLEQQEETIDRSINDIWDVSSRGNEQGIFDPNISGLPNRDRFAQDDQPSPALIRTRQGSHFLQRRSGFGDKLRKSREAMSALNELMSSTTQSPAQLSRGVTSYTPGSLLKGSLRNQSHRSDIMTTPLSNTRKANREHMFTTPKASLSMMDESGATRELILGRTPVGDQSSFFDQSTMDGNRNESNFSFMNTSAVKAPSEVNLLEDPVGKTRRDLISTFHGCFSSHHKPGDVLEYVESLHKACQNQIDELDLLGEMSKHSLCAQLMVDLNLERSTWELIHALYLDRIEAECLEGEHWDDDEPMMLTDLDSDFNSVSYSDKLIAEDFFAKNSSVRQAQLVVDWLEKNAHSNLKKFPEKINYFADMVTWENTLDHLKEKRNDNRHMVTEMDPDAPSRQGKHLADLDAKDEQSLIKHLFACVRAGQLAEAQQLCVKCGQPWRAATLEGWKLYHDPNFGKNLVDDTIEPVEGNPRRDLWKLVSWDMARDKSSSLHERALYASLSGDIKNILPVCSSWCDYVWAYFKVVVDVLTEQKLRSCSLVSSLTTGEAPQAMPSEYWNSILLPHLIFEEIGASPSPVIRKESCNNFHLIHKSIILGDMEGLVGTLHGWLVDKLDVDQLRFMSHLVLFVKGLGMVVEEVKCNEILEAYVKELTRMEHYTKVALYASQLPTQLQVTSYANLLGELNDPVEQRKCLDLGKKEGLNIALITKSVVERIKNIGMDSTLEEPTLELWASEVELTKVETSKIEVIKWLVFEEAQRAEAIIQGNALMRQFLASRKLKAARAVFSKLPPDSVEVVTMNWQSEEGESPLPLHLFNAIREYHCIQTYLDSNDAFNKWFQQYHRDKPEPPSEPLRAGFRGNVEYEQKMKQYKVDEDNWHSRLLYLSEEAESRLYNVLLFVGGGWMVDIPNPDGPVDEHRARQMRVLREMCIPRMCYLLHTIFHSTNQFSKCLRMADVIASERYKLYQLFHQHELEKILSLLHKSACCMVDDRKNNLGYPI